MNQFRVKAGTHFQGGREYKAGEIVLSEQNLAALFIAKFDDLGPVQESRPAPAVAVEEETETEAWEAPVKPAAKAKAKAKRSKAWAED